MKRLISILVCLLFLVTLLPASAADRNPLGRIEAESFDAKSASIAVQGNNDPEGGRNVYGIKNEYFMQFNNVRFTGTEQSVEFRISSKSTGKIYLRLDSQTAEPFGTVFVRNTGGPYNWTNLKADLPGAVSGLHTLYLTFETASTDTFLNINWFQFSTEPIYTPTDPATIRDTFSDTWVATDDLSRSTPTNEEVGAPKEKTVGMFYFIWHNMTNGELYNHLATYQQSGSSGLWQVMQQGPRGYQHYWAEPYFGYYRSDDEWIIRKHAQMLVNAGVDFIFFDASNASTRPEIAIDKVMKVFHEIREEGGQTPQITYLLPNDAARCKQKIEELYNILYQPGLYRDLWFQWDGKPLLLGNYTNVTDPEILEFFTFRMSWANNGWTGDGKNKWPWAALYPQSPGKDSTGKLEQVPVACGFWANNSTGRSYVNGRQTTDGKSDFEFGLLTDGPHGGTSGKGLAFDEQWSRAYELDPAIVMLTGWNEWWAGRWQAGNAVGQRVANTYTVVADTSKKESHYFVDNFNPEFSRDLEPMKGGFGDNYYYQTVQNIRKFKGVRPIPSPSGQKEIDLASGFDQWGTVGPEFRDTLYDTTHRDADSNASADIRYVNESGRNDIELAKVSHTKETTYFYVKTREDLTAPEGENWMNLFIDADNNASTGWYGYDYVINRSRSNGKVSIEKNDNNTWSWSTIGQLNYHLDGNELQIAVPNQLITGALANFDFKWADNSTTTGDIMEFMDQGDAAPDDRFNFRYQSVGRITDSSFYEDFTDEPSASDWSFIGSTLEKAYNQKKGLLFGPADSRILMDGLFTKKSYGEVPYVLSYDVQATRPDAKHYINLYAGIRMEKTAKMWENAGGGLRFAIRDNQLSLCTGNIINADAVIISDLPTDYGSEMKRFVVYDKGDTIEFYIQGESAEESILVCRVAVGQTKCTVYKVSTKGGVQTQEEVGTIAVTLPAKGLIGFGGHNVPFSLDNIRISTTFETTRNLVCRQDGRPVATPTAGQAEFTRGVTPYTSVLALYDENGRCKDVKIVSPFASGSKTLDIAPSDKVKCLTWDTLAGQAPVFDAVTLY